MKNLHWFLIATAIIGLAFLFRSPYAAYSIYAFLLLVGVANVSSLLWLSGLECTRSISRDILRQGEGTEVDVPIENTRGWPIPWIFVEDFHPLDFPRVGDNSRLAVLMPGQSIHLNYRLTCPRRGYHRIGPLMMETGDLFGDPGADHLRAAGIVLPGSLDQRLDALEPSRQMGFERAAFALARGNESFERCGKGVVGSRQNGFVGPNAVVAIAEIEHAFQLKQAIGRWKPRAPFSDEAIGDRKDLGQPFFVDHPLAGSGSRPDRENPMHITA